MQKSREWYSWVPTNLGEINIKFFGKSKYIHDKLPEDPRPEKNRFVAAGIDISFISDTHYFLSKWFNPLAKSILPAIEGEYFGTADIDIIKT